MLTISCRFLLSEWYKNCDLFDGTSVFSKENTEITVQAKVILTVWTKQNLIQISKIEIH
jgi:hypothetical protein